MPATPQRPSASVVVKDDGSSTYPILHGSTSTRAAVHKLDELTGLVEKLTKPANTTFRFVFILRLSTQGCAGINLEAARFPALQRCKKWYTDNPSLKPLLQVSCKSNWRGELVRCGLCA
ncbi:hypothetical protein llap_12258 [Limosa lapponica baueri]|uniref:Uncharacterized protein n=1 Tax=Limosa lapponica baueri TaxID=1758121 RepID=A0A2I0TUG9_LIMLA|nr:hypothetical protein llap_12258 [Limosa lapponica baueri]